MNAWMKTLNTLIAESNGPLFLKGGIDALYLSGQMPAVFWQWLRLKINQQLLSRWLFDSLMETDKGRQVLGDSGMQELLKKMMR